VESQTISRATATTEARNDEMDHRKTNGDPGEEQNGDRITTEMNQKNGQLSGNEREPAENFERRHT
jgi:hypothetical protein